MKHSLLVAFFIARALTASEPISISGIYPSLATFNDEGECGTGAVVPWADRLWVISYGPHKPYGSSDKLYEITPDLKQIIRPESIGGTLANRMIHRESKQLIIGPYVIDAQRKVRVIPWQKMPGRLTGVARHLTDPANKVYIATMEAGLYEVDVHTLEVVGLLKDRMNKPKPGTLKETHPATIETNLPGWHGKGLFSGQGRVVFSNNGEHGKDAENRLPKASHTYDGAHGWHTEWPRIRDIGESDLLMTMHGCLWRFPKTFSSHNSAGISPRSTHLSVTGDFCRCNDRIVFGCDVTAKSGFFNARTAKGKIASPGQSQSNLWFIKPEVLDALGPAIGRGAVWWNDAVKAGTPSDAYLFSGFQHRALWLQHAESEPVAFTLEVDGKGNGEWKTLRTVEVPASAGKFIEFKETEAGAWVRVLAGRDCANATAFFHYHNDDHRTDNAAEIFDGIATSGDKNISGGLLYARGENSRTLNFVTKDAFYELDGDLKLKRKGDAIEAENLRKSMAIPARAITADAASALYVDEQGRRWRLPKGDDAFEISADERVDREVVTERELSNCHGTFYELPAKSSGDFGKIRPICTQNRHIKDYATYRGLLVMSGITANAKGPRIIRSDDGKSALWVGAIDDLWKFGKPRGTGGPWKDSAVKAGEPSDPYLASGYDHKSVTLSHNGGDVVNFRIEADISGTGQWIPAASFTVKAGEKLEHKFPDAFAAYWLRVVADQDLGHR